MKIETKYEVGNHIWVIYEHGGEAHVYDAYINTISYDENGLLYITDGCVELKEEEIVLYDDMNKMVEKIVDIMVEIHIKKKSEGE